MLIVVILVQWLNKLFVESLRTQLTFVLQLVFAHLAGRCDFLPLLFIRFLLVSVVGAFPILALVFFLDDISALFGFHF